LPPQLLIVTYTPASAETRQKRANTMRGQKRGPPLKPITDETRAKLAAAGRGRKHTEESRQRMSEARKKYWAAHPDRPVSEETRKKMSEAGRGHKPTPETIEKRVAPLRGRRIGEARHIVTTPEGEEILVHLPTFCKEHYLSYSRLRSWGRSHRGYTARHAVDTRSPSSEPGTKMS
jgi:hypothetical protein